MTIYSALRLNSKKKIAALAAITLAFGVISLSGCNTDETSAQTETSSEAVTSQEETAEESETSVQTTTSQTLTETTSESVVPTETSAEETPEAAESSSYRIYSPEVFDGVPDICDIDSINASRRDDMFKYAEPYLSDSEYDEEKKEWIHTYSNAAEYAEDYFGFSFDNASPVLSYVKEDFDLDGKEEYYLCMIEFLNTICKKYPTSNYIDMDGNPLTLNNYDIAALISVYYIDDNGESKLTLGKLFELAVPEYEHEPYTLPEGELRFEVDCGYEDYNQPQIIDYGDSRQLFWDQAIAYPMDYGADIFWTDKHIRIEYSEPSERLNGFFDYECFEYVETAEQQEDFILSGGVPQNTDINYIDENHYITWNGSEYVYSCFVYDKDTQTSAYMVKDEPIPWEEHK